MCADTIDTPEYKSTLNLPKTDFPMRAGLPKREPEWLARWAEMDVYGQLREKAKVEERKAFTLHDGPPYANGRVHMGHLMNKVIRITPTETARSDSITLSAMLRSALCLLQL